MRSIASPTRSRGVRKVYQRPYQKASSPVHVVVFVGCFVSCFPAATWGVQGLPSLHSSSPCTIAFPWQPLDTSRATDAPLSRWGKGYAPAPLCATGEAGPRHTLPAPHGEAKLQPPSVYCFVCDRPSHRLLTTQGSVGSEVLLVRLLARRVYFHSPHSHDEGDRQSDPAEAGARPQMRRTVHHGHAPRPCLPDAGSGGFPRILDRRPVDRQRQGMHELRLAPACLARPSVRRDARGAFVFANAPALNATRRSPCSRRGIDSLGGSFLSRAANFPPPREPVFILFLRIVFVRWSCSHAATRLGFPAACHSSQGSVRAADAQCG